MEGGIFQVEKTPHQWQVPRLDRTGHLRETKGQVGWLKLGEEGNEVRGPGELGQAGPHRGGAAQLGLSAWIRQCKPTDRLYTPDDIGFAIYKILLAAVGGADSGARAEDAKSPARVTRLASGRGWTPAQGFTPEVGSFHACPLPLQPAGPTQPAQPH